jgi:FKBP-type peptidyl-prolyl cis-trans isomerase (trigger factor)
MTHGIQRHENGNIDITITIPWEKVKETYNTVVNKIVSETELPGFRKGKAPRATVEEKLDKNKTYEEVIKDLLPRVYADAVKDLDLKPIVSPNVQLQEAKEGESWVFLATTAEKPSITFSDYKKAIRDMKAEKRTKIWVPGQEETKTPADRKEEEKGPTLDELLNALLSATKCTIPPVLLEQEVTKLLSDLIDQTKKLGVTVEGYLSATGRTSESIHKEYEEQAKRTLTLEFAIEAIADEQKIEVTDEAIKKVIDGAKSDEEKKTLSGNTYYLASILRRQETIKYLAEL